MSSYVTSYIGLFDRDHGEAPPVHKVEIPLIQRDYAQGRQTDRVNDIRDAFLDVLHDAVAGNEPVGLDFIYGDAKNGVLQPLDGQQRLTTLFLLHWYVAFRTGRLDAQPWTRFTYETRLSARRFCEKLVALRDQPTFAPLSAWITDQPWYLHPWRHDPTIQSMLVMMDAIDERLGDADLDAIWERLTNSEQPAVSFHVLPIEGMAAPDDLYIKMNSRGKPLTSFENFKALFERQVEEHDADRARELALKIDGAWSDVMWNSRGRDCTIDDAFLRYISYITDLCEWRSGTIASTGRLERRTARVFSTCPDATANLKLLFDGFEVWVGTDIGAAFSRLFVSQRNWQDGAESRRVALYGTDRLNLFDVCCHPRRENSFGRREALLLYAVILDRIHPTGDFPARLRTVRNLVEASSNEIRADNMPRLVAEVETIVRTGVVENIRGFNTAQTAEEREKAAMLAETPDLTTALWRLEDHPLLRGSLPAFDLRGDRFAPRAAAFEDLFADTSPRRLLEVTGAILAKGDYSRSRNYRNSHHLGSSKIDTVWRDSVFTGISRSRAAAVRDALAALLDDMSDSGSPAAERLRAIREHWTDEVERSERLGWRYYFVKYDVMRDGDSGIYFWNGSAKGYSVCMLNKKQLNSNYRDPFLTAMHQLSEVGPAVRSPWFTGWETRERWLTLSSGTAIRNHATGIAVRGPDTGSSAHEQAFKRVCEAHHVVNGALTIPQSSGDPRLDTIDRVKVGAALLRALVTAGL